VLDAEKYAKTQELAETARDFCDKVARLSDTVATVVDAVDRQVRLGHRHPTDPSSASTFSKSSPQNLRAESFRRRFTLVSRSDAVPTTDTLNPKPERLRLRTSPTRDGKAALTEREKLRAVGKRNQAAAESERRRRDSAVKSAAARERRRELERLQVEYESLLRVKAEQEALIARMSGGA
jgi:hypothetical protein